MARSRRYLTLFAAVTLVWLAIWLLSASRNGSRPGKLAVLFVGMTNNPSRTMGPPRVEVCWGATGMCALFLVTNTTRNEFLWFKTVCAEQKSAGEWKQLVPGANAWSGVEGYVWMPTSGCYMAVGWPPGLSTNAFWRLRVGYGRDPSGLATLINQKFAQPVLGRELFHSGKQEGIVSSSEVSQ